MPRLSLRNKFILYFLPLLLCMVLFGTYYIHIFSKIHQQLAQLQENVTPDAFAILELKEILSTLETGIKDKRIEQEQINNKIVRLRKIVSAHAEHEASLDLEDRSTHDMMHKAIRTMSLSEYIIKQSDSGWQDTDLADVSKLIHQELVALGPILDQHLKIHLTELTRAEAYVLQEYKNSRIFVFCSILVMSMVLLAVLVAMMRSILGPVKALEEGAKQIGDGNLDYNLQVSSGDELEYLAREFKEMAAKLSVSHAELDRKVKERTVELSRVNDNLQKEIVERKNAQEEQLIAEDQVHCLTQDLLKVQETERQQISLDLHDKVAQELSALKVAGEAIGQELGASDIRMKQEIDEWGKLLDRCVKTVRDLSYNLRPPGLEQIGLSSSVSDYSRSFTKKTGIVVKVLTAGVDRLHLDYSHAINIYRLIQEALNNTYTHAQATQVEIKLTASYPNFIVSISDDGVGFDIKEGYQKAMRERRLGLLGMQERVRMLKGTFNIQSKCNEGTKISIEIPVRDKTD